MIEYPSQRHRMVSRQLRQRGIHDARVLEVMDRVPREWFVPPEARAQAYDDRALPIGSAQTISQPYMVSLMTQELRLSGSEKVLEIGTGSGYQAAVLAELCSEVYTVERLRDLSLRARAVLDTRGYENVRFHIGDGTLGWAEHAPYDRIVVTAMAPALPDPLFQQLCEGGILVIPIGTPDRQTLQAIEKVSGKPRVRDLCGCLFVHLFGAQGWPDPSVEPGD